MSLNKLSYIFKCKYWENFSIFNVHVFVILYMLLTITMFCLSMNKLPTGNACFNQPQYLAFQKGSPLQSTKNKPLSPNVITIFNCIRNTCQNPVGNNNICSEALYFVYNDVSWWYYYIILCCSKISNLCK